MRKFARAILCGTAFASVGAAATAAARMEIPAGLEASQRLALTGIGWGEKGRIELGTLTGRFSRRSSSAEQDGGHVHEDWGGAEFNVVEGATGTRLEGRCRFYRAERPVGAFTFPRQRFAYRCRYSRNGSPLDAGLILEAVPHKVGRLTGISRGGEIHVGGTVLDIRAIHRAKGQRIESGTPLGYFFGRDDGPVGAVDLNGRRKLVYAPSDAREREAVLLASLSLALLWDPGE